MEDIRFSHVSVLLRECIEALQIKPNGIYVDCTTGGGGHSLEIAKRLTDGGRLIAIDRDEDALRAAGKRLADFADRVTFVHSNYAMLQSVLADLGIYRERGVKITHELRVLAFVCFLHYVYEGRNQYGGKYRHNRYDYDQFYDSKTLFVSLFHNCSFPSV